MDLLERQYILDSLSQIKKSVDQLQARVEKEAKENRFEKATHLLLKHLFSDAIRQVNAKISEHKPENEGREYSLFISGIGDAFLVLGLRDLNIPFKPALQEALVFTPPLLDRKIDMTDVSFHISSA